MTDANADADAASADADTETADDGRGPVEAEAIEDEEGTIDPDDLVARVAAHDERLAGRVADLATRLAALEAEMAERTVEVETLESKLKRARADFQNYKRRAKKREEELRERATEDLVERLLDVRDNLVRALEQDEDADIQDGVEATLASFDRVLADENVTAVEPEPGQDVDPERHEVVLREDDGEQPAGTIERVYRPGYELAGTVIRPAQVTVSEGDDDE